MLWDVVLTASLTTVMVCTCLIIVLKVFGSQLAGELTGFSEDLNELLGSEGVKRAMSIIGGKGGDSRSQKIIKNKLAEGFIEKNYGLLKMAGEQILGIDVDDMIEQYGAENVIQAITSISGSLGIDIKNMNVEDLMGSLQKGLNSGNASNTGELNRYKVNKYG